MGILAKRVKAVKGCRSLCKTIAPKWQRHELSLTRSLTLGEAGRYACEHPLAQRVLNRAEAVNIVVWRSENEWSLILN